MKGLENALNASKRALERADKALAEATAVRDEAQAGLDEAAAVGPRGDVRRIEGMRRSRLVHAAHRAALVVLGVQHARDAPAPRAE